MKFDPMSEVPTTDEQAREAIYFGKSVDLANPGWGLYQIYRERDGMSVLQSYEKVLLLFIGRMEDAYHITSDGTITTRPLR